MRRLILVSTPFARDGWYPEVLEGMAQMGPAAAEGMRRSPLAKLYPKVDWAVLFTKLRDLLGQDYAFAFPASLLSDNAAVFTGKSRRGKVLLELELERLGILFKHSTPYHPQTCGKVERFHQTLKRFLRKQPGAHSLAGFSFSSTPFASTTTAAAQTEL